jgi:putative exporter of polyketide antibiotics
MIAISVKAMKVFITFGCKVSRFFLVLLSKLILLLGLGVAFLFGFLALDLDLRRSLATSFLRKRNTRGNGVMNLLEWVDPNSCTNLVI